MDAVLKEPRFRKFFEEHFVVVTLTVMESADKKSLENPGAMDVLKSLDGDKAGLPFFAVLDAKGKVIANSNRLEGGKDQRSNIGYPVRPEEVDHFMKMLKLGAPKADPAKLKELEEYLRSQKIGSSR